MRNNLLFVMSVIIFLMCRTMHAHALWDYLILCRETRTRRKATKAYILLLALKDMACRGVY